MSNPYDVLGVRQGASQDEIKAAYKTLVKKYHPDQYANNPLSDLAQEKIKEINAAYDQLSKNKGSSYSGQSQSSQSQQTYRGSQNQQSQNQQSQQQQQRNQTTTEYADIRSTIEQNNINLADQMLDRIMNRNAEWNYLKGITSLKKGWYDQAFRYITVATSLEPYNMEYRNTLQGLQSRTNSYNQQGNFRGYNAGGSFCSICNGLLCADCCCECMGGDFIRCC